MMFRHSLLFYAFVATGAAYASPLKPSQTAFVPAPLRFTSEGTFHISVFQDLHYGEGEVLLEELLNKH